jgi:penicillin-binding protein 1B
MLEEVLRSGTAGEVWSRGWKILQSAGKTGTSRDGWFAGFTSQLLCVVWVGYDDNRDLNLEGARSALPIWAEFMKRAAQIAPYNNVRPFTPPAGVRSVPVCDDAGEGLRSEVFIAGTEPAAKSCVRHIEQPPPIITSVDRAPMPPLRTTPPPVTSPPPAILPPLMPPVAEPSPRHLVPHLSPISPMPLTPPPGVGR